MALRSAGVSGSVSIGIARRRVAGGVAVLGIRDECSAGFSELSSGPRVSRGWWSVYVADGELVQVEDLAHQLKHGAVLGVVVAVIRVTSTAIAEAIHELELQRTG